MRTRENRTGLTLIELMVVIAILGILSVIVASALRGAHQDTLVAKTRFTIAKIEAVLSDRLDEYLTWDVTYTSDDPVAPPFPPDRTWYGAYSLETRMPRENRLKAGASEQVSRRPILPVTMPPTFPAPGLLRERVRLAAVRDVMRMEMPDCIGDLFYFDANANTTYPRLGVTLLTGYVRGGTANIVMRPDITARYRRIHEKILAANAILLASGRKRLLIGPPQLFTPGPMLCSDTFMNEELLFMVVEDTFVDGGPALAAFGATEIADLDEDGLKEFVDGWGNPIRWLRWPAGYRSVSPPTPDPLDPYGIDFVDGFDPGQADVGYESTNEVTSASTMKGRFPLSPSSGLRPLIVSSGPDNRFGIRFQWGTDPLGSSSEVSWPLTGTTSPVSRLGYWTGRYRWPDPYYPRIEGPLPSPTALNPNPTRRLGGIIHPAIDIGGEVFAVDMQLPSPVFLYREADGQAFEKHVPDNVTNQDESGASL